MLQIVAQDDTKVKGGLDPFMMMTVAAIDRLVHHAIIVEIKADSFRKKQALERSKQVKK